MKKYKIILIPLIAFLVGCNAKLPVGDPAYATYDHTLYNANTQNGNTIIDFYAINDFHGALEENATDNEPGIGKLTTYLKNKRSENPGGTVFIANGDMWQGSTDSNITRGKIVNHALNHLTFDAFTLGNHEFDWGKDVILQNKEHSNYPYLGENILYDDTKTQVDFVDESPLIERDGVNIGIIGTMGSDILYTIAPSMVENIYFDQITSYVRDEAERLRDLGANLIVLAAHDTWYSKLTPERSLILDEGLVDAVFTGHQHVLDDQLVNGIPVLQTRGRGKDVMHVQLGYNKTTDTVTLLEHDVDENIINLNLAKDPTAENIFSHYEKQYQIGKIKNEVVGTLKGGDMTESQLGRLTVKAMSDAFSEEGVVGAIHNQNGGIRGTLKKGKIKYNDVYKVLPFDNEIYIVSLSYARMNAFISSSGNYVKHLTVTVADLVPGQFYKVVTISFLHEQAGSPVFGTNYENQFVYARDLVADYFRDVKSINAKDF